MFNLPNLRIDRISFWLGFFAASLLWWLLGRIRPLIPHWVASFHSAIDTLRLKSLANVEVALRQETIRKAQRQHIASALFSLDDLVIQPLLLAPTTSQEPSSPPTTQSIASRIIPHIPDRPEISAPYGIPVITPFEAVQYGRNIAIIGQPGSGKSTALSHLACEIARQENLKSTSAVPLFLHVLDLQSDLSDEEDPILPILKVLTKRGSLLMQTQLIRFVKAVLRDKQRRVILLLDGLDELPQSRLKEIVGYLTSLHSQYPRLQSIVTTSPDYSGGLTRIGYYPLGISAWTFPQREFLFKRWGDLWQTNLAPEQNKLPNTRAIDPTLYHNWLSDEGSYLTPLEWTLRIWGAYTGDLSGSNPTSILKAHISRFLFDPTYTHALEELALRMVTCNLASLSFDEFEKKLSGYKPGKSTSTTVQGLPDQPEGKLPQEKTTSAKTRRSLNISIGEQIVNELIAGGILTEYASGQIGFGSPVFLGLLAGMKITSADVEILLNSLNWPAAVEALHYTAACNEDSSWVAKLIQDPAPPLFRNLFTVSRWLRDAPVTAKWRSDLMRTLVIMMQNEALPFSIRLRLIGAFYLSRDPSTAKLFKQLLTSNSPAIRRAALLGCGVLGSPSMINDILGFLADPIPEVRYTACLALSAIPAESATNAIVEVLMSGDEEIRQAAAEALAMNPEVGYKLLKEAAFIDDLLVRRASVFGIAQVKQPWAQQTLEKMAVEDGQWVVRNAAAQALDTMHHNPPSVPLPLPPPSETAWLLTFASNLGMGILPGHDAVDVLLTVLNSGSEDEQIAALQYLFSHPSENVISSIYPLLYGKRENLRESALLSLWWMSQGGVELPNPSKFGLK